jgi:hypothetical protein
MYSDIFPQLPFPMQKDMAGPGMCSQYDNAVPESCPLKRTTLPETSSILIWRPRLSGILESGQSRSPDYLNIALFA